MEWNVIYIYVSDVNPSLYVFAAIPPQNDKMFSPTVVVIKRCALPVHEDVKGGNVQKFDPKWE